LFSRSSRAGPRASVTAANHQLSGRLGKRIERDYQELKQELGLGDYEGRGWRGFHHHAASVLPRMAFWSPNAAPSPQHQVSPRRSRDLLFPTVIDPEAPPIRRERHIPSSIATIGRRLIAPSPEPCQDAAAAMRQSVRWQEFPITGAVRLV